MQAILIRIQVCGIYRFAETVVLSATFKAMFCFMLLRIFEVLRIWNGFVVLTIETPCNPIDIEY